jgi:hypothetical protein
MSLACVEVCTFSVLLRYFNSPLFNIEYKLINQIIYLIPRIPAYLMESFEEVFGKLSVMQRNMVSIFLFIKIA